MQKDDSCDGKSDRSPGSEAAVAVGQYQPSVKLKEKLEQLAKWRINPSLIRFPENAIELQGGHATVVRAFLDRSLTGGSRYGNSGTKIVAVKKLKITAEKDLERLLELALREAKFLVELSHPNIVRLDGFVEDVTEGIIWLVFPWEENGNLREFVASRDWEIPERICLINDVAAGVEYLHSRNPPICHGDLKSINILVNSNCNAVITDFGSARRLKEADIDAETGVGNERQPTTQLEAAFCADTNTITLTGNEFTLRWAAPELLKDEPPTVKVDIWALGWISYEVMTNAIPFEDVVKDTIVIRKVIQGDLPSITGDARMSLMLRLCSLMSKCWSSGPSQRPTAKDCQKLLYWMPKAIPNPKRTASTMGPQARSPQLLVQLGDMHQQQGDYHNASTFYNQALGIFTDTADRKGRAQTLERLARVHLHQGRTEEAVSFYSDALKILSTIDEKLLRAKTLWSLAQAYKFQGKYDEAATAYADALKISTDIDYSYGKAISQFGLAELHRLQGEYTQAILLYSEVMQLHTDAGDQQGTASALWGLAAVHRLQKEYEKATKFYSEALQIYTDIGDSRGRAFALLGLAQVNGCQGRHNDAINLYEQAAKVYEQIGNAGSAANALEAAESIRREVQEAA